ncbi:MAG: hypothetical protein RID59_20740, partial [Hoeflea sp.]
EPEHARFLRTLSPPPISAVVLFPSRKLHLHPALFCDTIANKRASTHRTRKLPDTLWCEALGSCENKSLGIFS